MDLFDVYQDLLVKFANNPYGRKFLLSEREQSIWKNNRIVKVQKNAFFVDRGEKVTGIFRTYNLYEKLIGITLSDIHNVKNSHYKDIIAKKGELRSLLHYAGLTGLNLEYPFIHNSTQIFAGSEDGNIGSGNVASWALARGAVVGTVSSSVITISAVFDGANYRVNRGFLPFTGIPAGAISAASIWCKENGFISDDGSDIHVVNSTQSDTLATTDIDNVSFVSDGHLVPTDLVYNEFVLNATGIGNISTTAKFALIQDKDLTNTSPSTVIRTQFFTSEESGTGSDPYLSVTQSSIKTINGLAVASVKTVEGLAIASVKTKDGLA